MPWKECSVMDERLRFVARLLDGEAMTEVCREFGISRKTGYKIFDRYKEHGLEALSDRSRRPVRYANQLPPQIETPDRPAQAEKPHWGARKIRELLVRRLDGDVRVPAKSTIHAVLDRHGLVKRSGRPRHRAEGTPLSQGARPNELWCADFKGEFKLGNGRYCYPLTVTDHASRFLLLCEALEFDARRHRHYRLRAAVPRARPARTPSAPTTACPSPAPTAVQSLQALGLVAAAGHRHRAHQARPSAAERPPRAHASDAEEGSHPPARHQQPAAAGPLRRLRQRVQHRAAARGARHEDARPRSTRPRHAPTTACRNSTYPLHDATSSSPPAAASACTARRSTSHTVLAGQAVGIKEVDDGIWLVSFMHYDLGYIDLEQKTLQPLDNPFGPRLLPMS